jgi:hypothetical protein
MTHGGLPNGTTNDRRRAALSTLSAGIAAVLATASFVALREQYRGECLWIRWNPAPNASYDSKFLFLNFFALLFFACCIWFGAEVVRAVGALAKSSANPVALAAMGALLAMFVYSGVGFDDLETEPNTPKRRYDMERDASLSLSSGLSACCKKPATIASHSAGSSSQFRSALGVPRCSSTA